MTVPSLRPARAFPPGVRLCNPLNIKRGIASGRCDLPWRGLHPIQSHHIFVRFIEPVYGFRAASRILRNYQVWHQIKTVRQVIERFAPAGENDVQAYVSTVVQLSGFGADEQLELTTQITLVRLLGAMVCVEIGRKHPYRDEQIHDGVFLSLAPSPLSLPDLEEAA